MPVVTIGGRKVFVVPELKTPHKFIYIHGNSAFTKENGVVSGSGTANDPYIIENWDIDTSENRGIDIYHTTLHFIIRNCLIHRGEIGGYYGICFQKVSNGKIDNVTSYNNRAGIYLDYSSNDVITNCNVYNNHNGIHLYSSSNIKIHYNNIYDNTKRGVYNYNSTNEFRCDARNNWWGRPIGPGNDVLGNVEVEPWLKDKR